MSRPIVHIVGHAVVVQDRYCRQRCAWCEAVLVDEDLTLIAVAGGGGYNPFWLTGELLEIEASDDGSIVRKSVVRDHGGVLPDHACTPARPRKLSLVPA